jgi:hypothetical protein
MTIASIIRYQIDPFQRNIQEHGSAFQEAAIRVLAYSSAPKGILSFGLTLWGLRFNAMEQSS